MCVNCALIQYWIGNVTYILERLASCCALMAVVTCIVVTVIIVLSIGIGLGYNYCFIEGKTNIRPTDFEVPDPASVKDATTKGPFPFRRAEMPLNEKIISSTGKPIVVKPTMVVPLQESLDFLGLIAKIREHKRNVTLELVT